jgi:mono/diheme cytochrome c family protein
MRGKHALLLIIAFSIPAAHGEAQEIGHAGAGLALAQRLCAQCHAVQKAELNSPNGDSPSFRVIASVPGMTAMALSAALNSSHRRMPNVMLEPDEQNDVIAYILSLK